MTWASVSLRKMELKNRINNLEGEDIKIQQELETAARKASQDEQSTQMELNYNKSLLYNDYKNALEIIEKNGKNEKDTTKQQKALMDAQEQYNQRVNIFQSIQEAKSNAKRDITDTETKTLEAQKEQIETQLKVARSEYESLGQAMDTDVQSSTIHLV